MASLSMMAHVPRAILRIDRLRRVDLDGHSRIRDVEDANARR
jgi:hypothetical protein